ncbi:MAG: hypothetical protein JSV20_07760 [Candidatus Bathyarchaeota archaeon]|nr:MAG: hypothetical protein JSV20_07760 [Candidatus Bathyarchaeota archaeon]
MDEKKRNLKRMADLLKSGATMLSDSCPECSSPLFKIRGEIWCPTCNKQVLIVKEGESASNLIGQSMFDSVEKIVLSKLQQNIQQIKKEEAPSKLNELGVLVLMWLDVLEKIKELKSKRS